ncbi:MAG TPA: hypothetical protein VHL53_09910 [Acidimicrobiia bacterium]|nr:hypothetical protein [Acidimicrobiia bacterium]
MDDRSEFPAQEWPDVPRWTENYCYVAYDPTTELGLWTHLGRAPFDPTLWRELSLVFLPSGERLVNKGYGRTETARGPGAATLAFECVEPWKRWRTRRDGASIRTTALALDAGMLSDRAHERVAFDLDWEDRGPLWDWGEVEAAHSWGRLHYEQLATVAGHVTVGGSTVPFSGAGIRDHTRGPRDFRSVERHIWAWGNFPSGRGFMLLGVNAAGQALTRAVTVEGDELIPRTLTGPPMLASRADAAEPYRLQLDGHRISAEILHVLPGGFDGPNDICLGFDPAVTATANFEAFTRFEWDGEVGYGLTERSVRRS